MAYTEDKLPSGLDAKTTPIDADVVVVGDSADSNRARKVTWANLKATLKTYFDSLYADVSVVTNATHTGEVTGSGALTVDKTAVTNKSVVSATGADYILISDTSDGGNLKKALASDLATAGAVEGEAVLSTGETGGSKFLREDGDGTSSWQSISASTTQLPTYIVAASGGDYTTIQAALDAAATNYPQGCRIFLADDVYTLSATLLVKSNNVVLDGNYRGTEIDVDGSSVTPAIKTNAPASLFQGLQLRNLSFIQTHATAQGVCIDASDMALGVYDNLIIYNFGTGMKFVDTQNITFYNQVNSVQVSANAGKCIDIDSSSGNPVNNNTFKNLRLSYGASGTGVHLDNAQLNVFYSCNFEPTSTTGTTGIKLVATTPNTTINNTFYSPYVEANAVGISVGSGVHRTLFVGGQVVENTSNLSDSGTNTEFVGTDINYTQTNKVPSLTVTEQTDNALVQVGILQGDRATPTDGDEAYVSLQLSNDGGTQTEMVRLRWTTSDVTAGTEDGALKISVMNAGSLVGRLQLTSSALSSLVNDTVSLGTATLQFSDLFLAEGAVINWDNGDVTLTQTGNVLKLAGGSLETDGDIELGNASDTTISRVSAGVVSIEGSNILTATTGLPVAGGTMTGNITLAENASVDLDPSLSADGKYTGTCITGTAGATLAFGDLVYLQASDSRWELADADAVGTAGTVLLGICVLAAAADGNATKILLHGNVRADTAFPTLTIGAPVYVGTTAGDVQVAAPTGADDVVRVVGYALTADSMLFMPSPDHITHVGA